MKTCATRCHLLSCKGKANPFRGQGPLPGGAVPGPPCLVGEAPPRTPAGARGAPAGPWPLALAARGRGCPIPSQGSPPQPPFLREDPSSPGGCSVSTAGGESPSTSIPAGTCRLPKPNAAKPLGTDLRGVQPWEGCHAGRPRLGDSPVDTPPCPCPWAAPPTAVCPCPSRRRGPESWVTRHLINVIFNLTDC